MNQQKDNEKDDSINDALSALGWVEERDPKDDSETENPEEIIKNQAKEINILKKQITELKNENSQLEEKLKTEIEQLKEDLEKPASNEGENVVANQEIIAEKNALISDLEDKLNQQRTLNINSTAAFQKEIQDLKLELDNTKNLDVPSDSTGEIDSKNGEIQEKILEIEAKNKEIQDLTQKIEENNNTIEDFNEKTKISTAEIESLRTENSDSTSKIQDLESSLEQKKNENDQLQSQIQESSNLIDNLNTEVNSLKAQNEQLLNQNALNQSVNDEVSIITAERNNLLNQTAELNKYNEELKSNIISLQNTIESVKSDLNNAQNDAQSKTQKLTELIQELETYKNEYVDLKGKYQEIEEKDLSNTQNISSLQLQLDEDSKAIADYKEKIIQKDAAIEDLSNQIKGFNDQIQYMEADTVKRTDYEELKHIIENKDEVITLKEKKLFELEKSLELEKTASLEITKLKSEISSKNEQLERMNKIIENAQTEIKDKETINSELAQISELNQEMVSQKNVLYDQITKQKEKILGQQAIIDRLEKKVDDMRGKGIKENFELDNLRKEQNRLEAVIRQKDQEIEEQKNRIPELEEKLSQITNERDSLTLKTTEFSELKSKTDELESKITDLKEEIEEKDGIEKELLDEIQKLKDSKVDLEKELTLIKEENINYKKRIKMMRRDLSKYQR